MSDIFSVSRLLCSGVEGYRMPSTKLYRSYLIAALAAAAVFTGCSDSGKQHATIKKEQYDRWNMTRIAVMYQLATQQYEVGDYDKCKDTLKQCLAFNAPHAVFRGAIEVEPVSRREGHAVLVGQREPDAAGQTMERELSGNAMRRKGRAGLDHQMNGFELVRLDQRGRGLAAETGELDDFAGPCMMKRHIFPYSFTDSCAGDD